MSQVVGEFVYTRFSGGRETSVDSVVADHRLPTATFRFSDKTGQTTYATPFTCQSHDDSSHGRRQRQCVSDDGRVNVIRDFDALGRPVRVIMSFRGHIIFHLQVLTDL